MKSYMVTATESDSTGLPVSPEWMQEPLVIEYPLARGRMRPIPELWGVSLFMGVLHLGEGYGIEHNA